MHYLFILICLCLNFSLYGIADRYQIIDLGFLDYEASEPTCINNKSEICGTYTYDSYEYAFIWANGESNYKFLRAPLSTFITDSGTIYGSYFDWVSRGFWDLDQETIYMWEDPFSYFTGINTTDLGYPSTLFSTGHRLFTVALWDANDQGQLLVMDRRIINRDYKYEVWLYDQKAFKRIKNPYLNAATRINNHAQVMGFYFENLYSEDGEPLLEKGKKTVIYNIKDGSIALFDMAEETWGEDMNDLGEVAGLLKGWNGKFTGFFGTPDEYVKIPNFSPIALNNCGQIIGEILHNPNKGEPAIWEAGQLILMSNLLTLVDDKGNEWDRIDELTDINDLGEIIGQGVINGKPHGFLLKPVAPQ